MDAQVASVEIPVLARRQRPPSRRGSVYEQGFDDEPRWWPDDGGTKCLPIYDRNGFTPRLVRKVGWTNC